MRSFILVIIFFFSIFTPSFGQDIDPTSIKLGVKGGLSYLFNDEHTSTFEGYQDIEKRVGTNIGVNINYLIDISNILILGTEYNRSMTFAHSSSLQTEWVFQAYSIYFGYQYNFLKISSNIFPYVSTDVSYLIGKERIIKKYTDENIVKKYYRTESGFGIDGNVGLVYTLTNQLELLTEIKLRYANASAFTEDSKYNSIEFSGIYFNIGINYDL